MKLFTKSNQLFTLYFCGMLSLLLTTLVVAADLDSRIFEFQQKLAIAGKFNAQYKLAFMYEKGRGIENNQNKAIEWYMKAAANDHNAAKHRLVFLEIKKAGFKPIHVNWINKLKVEAEEGDAEINFLLAEIYENGIGVKKDIYKARNYYQTATLKGNVNAESRLFYIDQQINKQRELKAEKARAEKAARQQVLAKKERQRQLAIKAEKDKLAQEEKQRKLQAQRQTEKQQKIKQDRLKIEQERQAREARKIEANKLKAAKQDSKSTTSVADKDELFESDLCSGSAARFRTQCN